MKPPRPSHPPNPSHPPYPPTPRGIGTTNGTGRESRAARVARVARGNGEFAGFVIGAAGGGFAGAALKDPVATVLGGVFGAAVGAATASSLLRRRTPSRGSVGTPSGTPSVRKGSRR